MMCKCGQAAEKGSSGCVACNRVWTIEEIREGFNWSNTLPDMRDRVTRAIYDQQKSIAACTGSLNRAKEITWCGYDDHFPLSAGNFRFDAGGWAENCESILAVRK